MVADPAAADELQLSEAIVIEGLLWLSSYIAFRNKLIQLIVIIITFDNLDRSFPLAWEIFRANRIRIRRTHTHSHQSFSGLTAPKADEAVTLHPAVAPKAAATVVSPAGCRIPDTVKIEAVRPGSTDFSRGPSSGIPNSSHLATLTLSESDVSASLLSK
jgi:hypothetical protein